MAIVNIIYHCGCEFSTTAIEEAVKHANTTKHTLDVLGGIKPSEPKTRKMKTSSYAAGARTRRVGTSTPVTSAEPETQIIDFSNLRARLQKR
jgi:hypothetical protein